MSNVFGPKKPLFGPYTYRTKQNSNGDTLIAVYHGAKRIAHIDAYWSYSMRALEEHEEDEARRGTGRAGERGRRLVCATDLRALGAVGKYPNVLRVGHAFMDDDAYKGKGIGRAMYEAMMVEGFAVRQTRIGGQPGPMFLVPDECGGAGNTSADAKRVWASLARDYPSQGTSIRVDAPPVIGSRAKVNPRRRNPAPPNSALFQAHFKGGDMDAVVEGLTGVKYADLGPNGKAWADPQRAMVLAIVNRIREAVAKVDKTTPKINNEAVKDIVAARANMLVAFHMPSLFFEKFGIRRTEPYPGPDAFVMKTPAAAGAMEVLTAQGNRALSAWWSFASALDKFNRGRNTSSKLERAIDSRLAKYDPAIGNRPRSSEEIRAALPAVTASVLEDKELRADVVRTLLNLKKFAGAPLPPGATPCPKCGGTGFLPAFISVQGGECFACEGTGVKPPDDHHDNPRRRNPRRLRNGTKAQARALLEEDICGGARDDYFYHVTAESRLDAIARYGLVPGKPANFANQREYSAGKVFVSHGLSTARLWEAYLYDTLDEGDRPVILRIRPEAKLRTKVYLDEKGTEDAGCSFYLTSTVKPQYLEVLSEEEEERLPRRRNPRRRNPDPTWTAEDTENLLRAQERLRPSAQRWVHAAARDNKLALLDAYDGLSPAEKKALAKSVREAWTDEGYPDRRPLYRTPARHEEGGHKSRGGVSLSHKPTRGSAFAVTGEDVRVLSVAPEEVVVDSTVPNVHTRLWSSRFDAVDPPTYDKLGRPTNRRSQMSNADLRAFGKSPLWSDQWGAEDEVVLTRDANPPEAAYRPNPRRRKPSRNRR